MFTGIVAGLYSVAEVVEGAGFRRLTVDLGDLAAGLSAGASVAVNGCCLTVEALAGPRATFHVLAETLRLTTFGAVRAGDRVNVERSLRAGDELGGHFVSGHVDGVGQVVGRVDHPGETVLTVRVPATVAGYVVLKGSLTVDGVSLTITAIVNDDVSFALIPHTLAITTLGAKRVGDRVHLEADLIGKWVKAHMEHRP